ncbi:ABC-F family ATP-binding cassette domain-containing protein [Spirochaetia bacterium 38H-sp]|uniref:ABC-F family ATP-binding cassette domain-containing protein n=1 Tax=Rarispira pelagica TaxID=3141764 RepID=A0ABU9UCB5_9SPIR
MASIGLDNISLRFGPRSLIESFSWTVDNNTRAALVGPNGSGKSTLLKLLAGIREPDEGKVIFSSGCRMGYLPQWGVVLREESVLAHAEKAYEQYANIEKEITNLSESIKKADTNAIKLSERIANLSEQLERSGYYTRHKHIHRVLSGLGFSDEDMQRPCSEFSGGWQMRIALARILLSNPDILLMDEPTNYLDIEARLWLGDFLRKWQGGIVLVSHDRDVLDNLVDKTVEIFAGKAKIYRGNYSSYLKQRENEIELIIKRYEEQQKEKQKLESFINRFRANANKASLVQSRIIKLEKMEEIELPPHLIPAKISFPQAPPCSQLMIRWENLSKSYGDMLVFSSYQLEIQRGDRVLVSGPNGAGKTTLLRILAGEDKSFSGELRYGKDVKIGYFSQDTAEKLSEDISIMDYMLRFAGTREQQARDILGAFLFSGDDVYKSLSVLSGGERARVALATLFFAGANLLIMDEPTNHLDIHSKDALCDALMQFGGAIVLVSHDAYFNRKIASRTLYIRDKKLAEYPGSYSDYLKSMSKADTEEKQEDKEQEKPGNAQLLRQRQKELKRDISRIQREEQKIMEELEILAQQKQETEHNLSLPENYADGEKVKQLTDQLKKIIEEEQSLMEIWEHKTMELAQLEEELEKTTT